MNTKELSHKQQLILNFIGDFQHRRGYAPAIREIVQGCRLSSTSLVEYHLNILEREGYLRRDVEISRSIRLLGGKRLRHKEMIIVPVVGTISAGTPIPVPSADTWSNVALENLELPPYLVGGKDRVYALRVKGDSMVDALIDDGDVVLMQQVSDANNGEMVAIWLKSEREATLKKVYWEQDMVRLQPCNTQMKPIYVHPSNVEIQGKVIGVIRQLS